MDLLIEILAVIWSQLTGGGALHTLSNVVHLAFLPMATLFGIQQICAGADAQVPQEYR